MDINETMDTIWDYMKPHLQSMGNGNVLCNYKYRPITFYLNECLVKIKQNGDVACHSINIFKKLNWFSKERIIHFCITRRFQGRRDSVCIRNFLDTEENKKILMNMKKYLVATYPNHINSCDLRSAILGFTSAMADMLIPTSDRADNISEEEVSTILNKNYHSDADKDSQKYQPGGDYNPLIIG